jgi:hypothetical protein
MHVASMGKMRNAFIFLVRKPLRRSRNICEDDSKMNLREIDVKVWTELN